jgi:HEAT repeat protein
MTPKCWILLLVLPILTKPVTAAAPDATRAKEMLEQALSAHNPETRKMGVVALSLAANDDPLMDRLAGMLDDKDVEVRLATISSLSEVKSKPATAALVKALSDDVPEVSFAAAKALFARNEPDGKRELLAVLEGETKTASGFLTKQKRDALRMMHTPRTTFMYAVKEGMGFVPVPGLGQGIASMQGILSDPGVSGRASAALLLSKENDPVTLGALKDALYDKDWRVRAAAVHSLALKNQPSLKKNLEPLMDDDREDVRLRAAAGWLRLTAIASRRPAPKRAPAPKK